MGGNNEGVGEKGSALCNLSCAAKRKIGDETCEKKEQW